jgi:hypothetical protein
MAGPGTATASTKIDDEQRGLVGEPHLGQERKLFWRGLADTPAPGRGISEPGAAGESAVDTITGADPRPSRGSISDIDRGLATPTVKTATVAPAPPPDPDPAGRYVDDFFEAIYDINDSEKPGHLSTRLTVVYGDGTRITIKLDEIGDEDFAPFSRDEPFFVLGRGGRTFPRVMNRGTVHNLWSVKQQAQIIMEEFNADFSLIMNMSMVAISFVFPPPTAGLPWRLQTTIPPRTRPWSHAAYDRLDVIVNRLKRRLGHPHIPEDLDTPLGSQPKPQAPTKRPYAILPNGTEIPPDHYGPVYHGTEEFTPQDVVRASGIPAKTGALDRQLYEHTAGGANSDFRGVTPFLHAPARDVGQGAAEWAVHNSDVGYVYKFEGAPVYELGQHLEGRIPAPLVGYRSSRPGTAGEAESVTHSRVPLRYITDVWRVTRVEGDIQIEKLDWSLIKATTKTSDIPSSL